MRLNLIWQHTIFIFVSFMAIGVNGAKMNSNQPLYKDPNQPVEKRINDLLSKMTLDEKIHKL